jgi:hypothetical protein
MDNLKHFIQQQRELFEDEPPAGHEERFRRKLTPARRKPLYHAMMPYMRIAGVILLFFISTLWILEHTGVLPARTGRSDKNHYEYQETEYYYITRINARLSSIEKMHFLGDSTQKKILYEELSNMDSLYLDLQKELKMNPGDERLLRAMTEYYEIKLDVLNNIIQQLSAIQTKNKKSHETRTL